MLASFRRIETALGRFFSSLPSLLFTLLAYLVLCLFTYLILRFSLPPEKKPGMISYFLATGGDPAPYLNDLGSYLLAYSWIMVFHVLSWLVIPVLAATAMDISFRAYDNHKHRAEKRLEKRMVMILVQEGKVSEDIASEKVKAEFIDWRERASRK